MLTPRDLKKGLDMKLFNVKDRMAERHIMGGMCLIHMHEGCKFTDCECECHKK